jgi:hypothetical protein
MHDILPPINMNFNPFRSTSQPTDNVPNPTTTAHGNDPSNASFMSDDSWHSNIPESNRIGNKAVAAAPTSAPLSWFSSWTTSSTTSTTINTVSSSTTGTVANTTITSQQISSLQTTVLAPPNNTRHNLPYSPSSFNMLRGVESRESEDANHPSPTNHQSASRNRKNTHYLARGESFGAWVKNGIIGANAGGGCMPTAIPTANHGAGDDLYSIIADVPFFLHRIEIHPNLRRRCRTWLGSSMPRSKAVQSYVRHYSFVAGLIEMARWYFNKYFLTIVIALITKDCKWNHQCIYYLLLC